MDTVNIGTDSALVANAGVLMSDCCSHLLDVAFVVFEMDLLSTVVVHSS